MIAYLITNTINNKMYVGICKAASPKRRWKAHRGAARRGNKWLLSSAIRKYGAAAFTVEAIASAKSWDDLCDLERILIRQYGTYFIGGDGYNMTRGGDGTAGVKQSASLVAKRFASRAGYRHSADTRFLIGRTSLGRGKGVPKTEAHKESIRKSKVGVKLTEQHVKNCIAGRMATGGYAVTEAEANRLRTLSIGRHRSAEHKEAIAASNRARAPGVSGLKWIFRKKNRWAVRLPSSLTAGREWVGTFGSLEEAKIARDAAIVEAK